jgi:hypothetical protein
VKPASETLFEQFLTHQALLFEPVPVVEGARRPDYLVHMPAPVLFEVKELTEDDRFGQGPHKLSHRTVGEHVRRKIEDSRGQIQYGKARGIPSVLLIYNALDPLHLFGTEDHDFRAAMHGEWTLWLSRETGKTVAAGYGANRSLQPQKNTSFSALARMAPRSGAMTVRLFSNMHAKLPLPPDLPACFELAAPG